MYEIHEKLIEERREYLTRLGYSSETVKSYIKNLKSFFKWIIIAKKNKLDQTTINDYFQYLHESPITSKTIQTKYNVIRHYDKYLEKTKYKINNQAIRITRYKSSKESRNINHKRNQKTICCNRRNNNRLKR